MKTWKDNSEVLFEALAFYGEKEIVRNIALRMVRSLPFEDLKELFHYQILDPRKAFDRDPELEEYYDWKLTCLKNSGAVEINMELKLNDKKLTI